MEAEIPQAVTITLTITKTREVEIPQAVTITLTITKTREAEVRGEMSDV